RRAGDCLRPGTGGARRHGRLVPQACRHTAARHVQRRDCEYRRRTASAGGVMNSTSALRHRFETMVNLATIASGLAVLVVAGLIIRGLVSGRLTVSLNASKPPSVAAVIDDKTTTVNETTVHHAGARLAIVEFSDFECPFCGKYARDVFPLVRDQLVESGRVDYVFRNFPLEKIHHNALQASQRAECAGAQRKYWEMHDRIFARQPNI